MESDAYNQNNVSDIPPTPVKSQPTTYTSPLASSMQNTSSGAQKRQQKRKRVLQKGASACTGSCRNCLKCCYKIMYRYSLNAIANLFLAYEYLLTLSFSQVSCERAFSKLKIGLVKTRLRSSLGNDKLETFMLMNCENDIVESITLDEVIACMSKDSAVYSRMLVL